MLNITTSTLGGILLAAAMCASLIGGAGAGAQANWPQWRGPNLDGRATSTNLPVKWSETENVRWKVPLPAWSGSTPIIWGDRIFVMTASAADGEKRAKLTKRMGGARKPSGLDVLLLCVNKADGKEQWRQKLAGDNVQIGKQDLSSPSPITDGEHVWALTGSGILTAFTVGGERVWRVDLQEKYGKFGLNWGYGASPALIGGKLIVPVLHGMTTDDPSYVVAFDPASGKVAWRVERPHTAQAESPDAYTTPVPVTHGGKPAFIISGADCVTCHDLASGKEVWRCGGLNPTDNRYYRTVGTPVVFQRENGDGVVVACAKQGPTIACKLGGEGSVTKTHTAWTSDISFDVPSPVADERFVYLLHDRGFLSCLDAMTGEVKYQRRRTTRRATFSASPLLAPGRLYMTNQKGVTAVVSTGPEFKLLAQNELDDDYTLSSLAVSGDCLFIRTSSHLYCIASEKEPRR